MRLYNVTIRWPGEYGENVMRRQGVLQINKTGLKQFSFGSRLGDTVTAHMVDGQWFVADGARINWSVLEV
jgi:hypothetical protein